jgi:DNA-binding HxlR family transcriptional regulator
MISEIRDFLQKKGAIEVIVEVGLGSSTFQDIEEMVLISSSTVSNRLSRGVEIDLFTLTERPTEYGTQKRYTLTDDGFRILLWIQKIDMDSTVRKLQRVQRQRENDLKRLLDLTSRDKKLINERISSEEKLKELHDNDDVPPISEDAEDLQTAKEREELETDLVAKTDESENGDTESNG